MTTYQMIWQALKTRLELDGGDQNTLFTTEEVTVEVWKAYPEEFCLAGFPEYPNHNKVVAALCHKQGPLAKGWVRRVGVGKYALVLAGVAEGQVPEKGETAGQKQLRRLLDTRAALRMKGGNARDLHTADAIQFFGAEGLVDLARGEKDTLAALDALERDESVSQAQVRYLKSVASALGPVVERVTPGFAKARG